MSSENTIVKGTAAVALHFGVARRTVQRWAKDPTFPKLPGRKFELVQIQLWLDRKDGRSLPPPAKGQDPHQPELTEQRGKSFQEERLTRLKADRAELDLGQRRGELVERAEVEQLFITRIMAVRQGLLSLSRALPPLLATCQNEREMEAIIAGKVRELQEEFGRPLPEKWGPFSGVGAQAEENVTQGGG